MLSTTLDLELLDHELFVLLRDRSLVQQTLRKLLFVCLNELISVVKAADKSNYRVQLLVHFILALAPQSLDHQFIAVLCHEDSRLLTLVHELHERVVSGLLE